MAGTKVTVANPPFGPVRVGDNRPAGRAIRDAGGFLLGCGSIDILPLRGFPFGLPGGASE